MKKEVKIAVDNLLRLNKLRIKKMLHKDTWRKFFIYIYKHIVKHNANRNELSDNVKTIIDA